MRGLSVQNLQNGETGSLDHRLSDCLAMGCHHGHCLGLGACSENAVTECTETCYDRASRQEVRCTLPIPHANNWHESGCFSWPTRRGNDAAVEFLAKTIDKVLPAVDCGDLKKALEYAEDLRDFLVGLLAAQQGDLMVLGRVAKGLDDREQAGELMKLGGLASTIVLRSICESCSATVAEDRDHRDYCNWRLD